MTSHRIRYAIQGDNDPPPTSWDSCWKAGPVQASLRFSCSGSISKYYAKRRTWEACPIDCMETLGNIYGNGSQTCRPKGKTYIDADGRACSFHRDRARTGAQSRLREGTRRGEARRRWNYCWTAATSHLRVWGRNVIAGMMTLSSRNTAPRKTQTPLPGASNVEVVLWHFH
jgi:hypothetical protein